MKQDNGHSVTASGSTSVEQRHGGRKRLLVSRAACGRRILGIAIAAAIVPSAEPLAAGDREPGSGRGEAQTVALHQPVSVEQSDPAAADRASTAGRDRGAFERGGAKVRPPDTVLPARTQFLRPRKSVDEGRRRAVDRTSRLQSESQEGGFSFPSGLIALLIVLLLVGVIAWAVRRWVPTVRAGENGLMRVVGRTNLSPKHSVSLIQLGNRFVMVGLSTDRLTTLCEVVDEEEVATLAARISRAACGNTAPKSRSVEPLALGEPLAAEGFEAALVREASDYVEPLSGRRGVEPEPPQPPSGSRPAVRVGPAVVGDAVRSSLNDLLRRVRSSQAK